MFLITVLNSCILPFSPTPVHFCEVSARKELRIQIFWVMVTPKLVMQSSRKLLKFCYLVHSKILQPVHEVKLVIPTRHLIQAHMRRWTSSQNFNLRWALPRPFTDSLFISNQKPWDMKPARSCNCLHVWWLSLRFLSTRRTNIWTAAPWILERGTN
jgi:hypothetical protein